MGLNNTLQVEGGSAEHLQKRWGWGAGRAHARVPERFWIGLSTCLDLMGSDSHRAQNTLILQTLYITFWLVLSTLWYECCQGTSRKFEGKNIWNVSGLGRSTRERCRSLLFSNLLGVKKTPTWYCHFLPICCLELGPVAPLCFLYLLEDEIVIRTNKEFTVP